MPFVNERRNNVSGSQGAQVADPSVENQPVDQLPFPDFNSFAPAGTTPAKDPIASPGVTFPLNDSFMQTGDDSNNALVPAKATRNLLDVKPGVPTTNLRSQVVIRGSGKRTSARPPQGRRWVVQAAVGALVIVIAVSALLTISPIARGNAGSFPLANNSIAQTNAQNNTSNFITAQQAATATAVTQDGYDPGTGTTYVGVATPPPSIPTPPPVVDSTGSTLGRFAYGQCTYWADEEYHNLSGYWVSWLGNAYQWSGGAAAAGWNVSSRPHVPSIIVLQAGTQGAGGYGHVAVVEGINSDGSVRTSNMNWSGGWGTVSYVNFTPGPGVSFVWHP